MEKFDEQGAEVMSFTAAAASVDVQVGALVQALGSPGSSVCSAVYMDLLQKVNGTLIERSSRIIGVDCNKVRATANSSYTITGLTPGADYVLRGRLECRYANVPESAAGFFKCIQLRTAMTLVWPTGLRAGQVASLPAAEPPSSGDIPAPEAGESAGVGSDNAPVDF